MKNYVRLRLWIEAGLAGITGLLFLLTLVWPEWIEGIFGVEPDGGSGSLEWMVVGGLLLATVTFSLLARQEWRAYQSARDRS